MMSMDQDLESTILRKSRESCSVQESFFKENASRIVDCCRSVVQSFEAGATLFVMGNGGSSCDASHLAVEFVHPIIEKRPALPALALSNDSSLMSAIGNDQDFSLVFSQQLQLLAKKGDIALAISTSGKSNNILRACRLAKEKQMLLISFTGKDGGRLTELCDYCFVVPSFSIHRIQETHGALLHVFWDTIHLLRGEEDVL